MKKTSLLLVSLLLTFQAFCQEKQDSLMLRKIYSEILSNGKCYDQLDFLCNKIGGRLSGSEQAQKAVKWGEGEMSKLGLDKVFLQEVMVPHWVRGEKEIGKVIGEKAVPEKQFPIAALGGSIATPDAGITSEVIEVKNFEELAKLGTEKIKGKIVFYNRPMDPTQILTFHAYGGAVDQRGQGAVEASKYGAVAVLVRSMTLAQDDNPHTGAMHYDTSFQKIPAAAISTNGANQLSERLKKEPSLKFFIKLNCKTLPDEKSYNVIGEIKGTEHPEEIVVLGGHLDSWDTGKGAHDDGSGVVQSLEVLRAMKVLNIKPKRTVRVVLFMNEENGLKGGKKYAEQAKLNNEKHIAGIETDAGGFSPRGFSMEGNKQKIEKIIGWKKLFEEYGLYDFSGSGGGADISPLKDKDIVLMELRPDSQRYFDYHHTPIDTFDKVNKRELEMGAASLASMVYLISEYGL